jgi:hypothetical protein
LLALLSLRRPRNLAALVASYATLMVFATAVDDPAATILALAPSSLFAPRIARLLGAREESAAALMTAALVASFPLLLIVEPGARSIVDTGLFAFVIGAALAGMVPTLRDLVLPVLDGARYAAAAIALVVAFLASGEIGDGRAYLVAAGCLLIGPVSAAAAARIFGGDPLSSAIGAGTRDPAIAAGIAVGTGMVGGAAVALAYAVLLVLAVALGKLLVRGQAGRESAR